MFDPKAQSKLVLPSQGRCVLCGNTNPCFMHTPVQFKRLAGPPLEFQNIPHALGAIMAKLDEIERKIATYLPVVGE